MTRAPRCCRCARRRACACACRWRGRSWRLRTRPLLAPHIDILRDELNVKEVELTTDVDRFGSKELILNPKTLGPRLGGRTQDVIKAHKAGDWTINADGTRRRRRRRAPAGGVRLPGRSAGEGAVATLKGASGLVVLDTDGHPRARARGPRPRPDPPDPAGAARRRSRRVRPDHLAVRGAADVSPPSRRIVDSSSPRRLRPRRRRGRSRAAPGTAGVRSRA